MAEFSRETVQATYPQFAWAFDEPEIGNVLRQAIDETWDGARVLAAIQDTKFWKNNLPAYRLYLEKQQTDPMGFIQSLRQLDAKLWDRSRQMGIPISPEAVDAIARQAIMFGWNDEQMFDEIGKTAFYQGGQKSDAYVGTIGTTMDQLSERAGQFMVPVDEATKFSWAKQVATGEKKAEDFDVLLRDQARSRFSYDENMMKRIEEGYAPADLLASQRKGIAELLEVSEAQVNLNDPRWNSVLEYTDEATGRKRVATYTEAQRAARKDPAWRKTENGQRSGAALVGNLSKLFTGA